MAKLEYGDRKQVLRLDHFQEESVKDPLHPESTYLLVILLFHLRVGISGLVIMLAC